MIAQTSSSDNVSTIEFPSKCGNCPLFQSREDGSDKGWCLAFERSAREYHPVTDDCRHAIITDVQAGEEQPRDEHSNPEIDTQADKCDQPKQSIAVAQVVSEPERQHESNASNGGKQSNSKEQKCQTETFKVYQMPRPGRYAVHNLSKGSRYLVTDFGDGIFSCSCPHHQKRSLFSGFTDKHIDAVEQANFSRVSLNREPIKLQKSDRIISQTPYYWAWCGDKYLGLVRDVAMADLLADRWFADERRRHQQNTSVVAHYAESLG